MESGVAPLGSLRPVGHIDLNQISFALPDGRPLLDDVSFRVGDGAVVALGPNGAGKTTLLQIIAGDLDAHSGAVTRSGGLGVMRQFIGSVRDESTIRDLLIGVAPERIATAARAVDAAELRIMEVDDEPASWPTPRLSPTGATSAGTSTRRSGTA